MDTLTPEEYFDSIYTYHSNDYVRMPLNELYELMEGYLKAHNKALNIVDVVGQIEQLVCDCEDPNVDSSDKPLPTCKNCFKPMV